LRASIKRTWPRRSRHFLIFLVAGEKPKARGNLCRVKELARERDHAINKVGFDDVLANLAFAGLVRRHGAVGENEASDAGCARRGSPGLSVAISRASSSMGNVELSHQRTAKVVATGSPVHVSEYKPCTVWDFLKRKVALRIALPAPDHRLESSVNLLCCLRFSETVEARNRLSEECRGRHQENVISRTCDNTTVLSQKRLPLDVVIADSEVRSVLRRIKFGLHLHCRDSTPCINEMQEEENRHSRPSPARRNWHCAFYTSASVIATTKKRDQRPVRSPQREHNKLHRANYLSTTLRFSAV